MTNRLIFAALAVGLFSSTSLRPSRIADSPHASAGVQELPRIAWNDNTEPAGTLRHLHTPRSTLTQCFDRTDLRCLQRRKEYAHNTRHRHDSPSQPQAAQVEGFDSEHKACENFRGHDCA